MSLINLSSTTRTEVIQQTPSNFKNYFPQPIIIKPHSQVCLTSFYHFRTEGFFRVFDLNNIIAFGFGDRNFNPLMYATLKEGRYTGDELATEISRAMNAVNLQQNYLWSTLFTAGNATANPPTVDVFEIQYTDETTPNERGGEWSLLSSRNTNGVLTNDDTEGETSQLVNSSGSPIPCILPKGLLLHEGEVRYQNLGWDSDDTDGSLALQDVAMGVVRQSMTVNSNDLSQATSFNSDFGDIRVALEYNADDQESRLVISNLNQRQGTSSINLPNNRGKAQTTRRVIDDTNLKLLIPSIDVKFAIVIHRNSSTRSWVVTLQGSTDGGDTYIDFADDAGGANATDGRPAVYSEDIGGVTYTSVIYSTQGVANGAGDGFVINPESGKSTRTLNAARGNYAPYIPYLAMGDNEQSTGTLDLDQEQLIVAIVPTQGSPALVTANLFTMGWDEDAATTANGYDYLMDIQLAAATASPQANETQFDGIAIKFTSVTGTVYSYDVYADANTPIAGATSIGTMTFDTSAGLLGTYTFIGTSLGTINNIRFFPVDTAPAPLLEPAVVEMSGIFNPSNNPITGGDGRVVLVEDGYAHTHVDPEKEVWDGTYELDAAVGDSFAQQSYLVLMKANVTDIGNNRDAPVRATGDMRCGNSGTLLGFNRAINVNATDQYIFTSDVTPSKLIDDNSIHISIPELTGIKSYEGEAETTGKTIKVIPKNEFNEDSTSGSMTFTANYEDWIDINNGEALVLNELTVQVRKPDGTMATTLEPITRATIKIQEDPEKKREESQRQMIEALSQVRTQAQNTGNPVVMDASSWVGS